MWFAIQRGKQFAREKILQEKDRKSFSFSERESNTFCMLVENIQRLVLAIKNRLRNLIQIHISAFAILYDLDCFHQGQVEVKLVHKVQLNSWESQFHC